MLLIIGVFCAAGIGYCLSGITADEPPWWAFAAIPLGIVLWVSFLAVNAWSSNLVFGASRARAAQIVVRPGVPCRDLRFRWDHGLGACTIAP
jgi:hypothetical protein